VYLHYFTVTTRQELLATRDCLCLAARRAAREITREFDRALRAHGLRATQFSLLAALELRGSTRVSDLAELLGTERTTLTRNLAVAEQHGLVRSAAGADARERILTISGTGRKALHAALSSWKVVQARVQRRLGEPAAESLRRICGGPSTLDSANAASAAALGRPQRSRVAQTGR
jgi:DNA-binding MarR family transcriptional regulator